MGPFGSDKRGISGEYQGKRVGWNPYPERAYS